MSEKETEKSILINLEHLPDKWDLMYSTTPLHMSIHRDDIGWLVSRISDDVDRGLIVVEINMRKSSFSCELDIMIRTVVDIASNTILQTAIGGALSLLLKEIKQGLMNRTTKRMKDREFAGVG